MSQLRIPWNKGLKGYMKGRIVSLETRIRQSESQLGKKNHNWKGGKSIRKNRRLSGVFYDEWKDAVIKRDRSTCSICGRFCRYPVVHHIFHASFYPELAYIPENGVTLCYDCHMVTHEVSGYKIKRGEFSEELTKQTLNQAWQEIATKVQRILDETKELYSMSVIPARAPCSKEKIYAEHTGDSMNQEIKSS
jgi:hypothetical protein